MKQLHLAAFVLCLSFLACSKADKSKDEQPAATTNSDNKSAEEQFMERKPGFAEFSYLNFETQKSAFERRLKFWESCKSANELLQSNRQNSDYYIITTELMTVNSSLEAVLDLEKLLSREGKAPFDQRSIDLVMTSYINVIQKMNSAIPVLQKGGETIPELHEICKSALFSIGDIKTMLIFERFKQYDAAGGSIEALANSLGIKL